MTLDGSRDPANKAPAPDQPPLGGSSRLPSNATAPRFKVGNVTGWAVGASAKTGSRPAQTIWSVLDHAYCHRVVAEFGPKGPKLGSSERKAVALAAALNAEHEAWPSAA